MSLAIEGVINTFTQYTKETDINKNQEIYLKANEIAFLKSEWEKFYLGPEFTSSMYIDAVRGEFSGYSTSPDRISWNDIDLITYFRNYAEDIK